MSQKKTILLDLPVSARQKQDLLEAAAGCNLIHTWEEPIRPEQIQQANIIFGNPEPELLRDAENLEWIQLSSAGADQYTTGVLPKGVILTNAAGAYGPSIGEYMVCMVMNLMLDLPQYRDKQKRHLWENSYRVRHIPGSIALSVGFGDIGREFAQRYHAMGGHVIGIKRTAGEKPEYVDELHTIDELDSLLPIADVVALSLPSTSATRHMFGEERFALMKKNAILVNVGRGTAVDTDALCEALASGEIGGAALDVTEPEPLPAEHPLWDQPNAIITPHVAGGWEVPENFERVFGIGLENLSRYLHGEPLKNQVDFSKGY